MPTNILPPEEQLFVDVVQKYFPKYSIGHLKSVPILYHYTDTNGAMSILNKNEFWATNIYFLNDSSELEYGLNIVDLNLEAFINTISDPTINKTLTHLRDGVQTFFRNSEFFLVSFCEDGDLLSQWRGYAKGTAGVSLGMAVDKIHPVVDPYGKINKIIYDPKIQNGIVKDSFDDLLTFAVNALKAVPVNFDLLTFTRRFMQLTGFFVSSFKHPSFSEEREWRLLIDNDSTPAPSLPIRFRSRNGVITPYVECPIGNKNAPNDYLSELIISPTSNQKLMVDSFQYYLTWLQFSNYKIRVSDIPYRD